MNSIFQCRINSKYKLTIMKNLISKAPTFSAVMGIGLVLGMSSFTKDPGDIVRKNGTQYIPVVSDYSCGTSNVICTYTVNPGVSHGAPYYISEVSVYELGVYTEP